MNITPPNAAILPFSVQRVSAEPDRQKDKGEAQNEQGFGALLAELQGEGGDGSLAREADRMLGETPQMQMMYLAFQDGITFDSGARAYSLKADVADHALAFQARPIVGPAAVDAGPQQAISLVEPQSPAADTALSQPLDRRGAERVPLDGLSFEPTLHARPSDGRIEAAATSRRATVAPFANPVTVPSVTRAAATLQSQQGVRPLVEQTQRIEQARSADASRPAQLAPQLQARAQLFAQLVAAATEYRVAVRGAQLSRADHDRLIADIRAALLSHGLADLPITVSTNSGAA